MTIKFQYAWAWLFLVVFHEMQAQTAFVPGDVAIIGYNFKDPDQFSFIFLTEAEEGTTLYFTDCGYDPLSAAFRIGEGYITYTVPSGGLKAGAIVTYPDDGSFIKQGVSGFFGLSVDGDQIFIFQGSFDHPVFIYGLNVSDEYWMATSTGNNNSALLPGLVDGVSAVSQSAGINGQLDCSRLNLDKGNFLKGIADETNWDRSSSIRYMLPNRNCHITSLGFEKETVFTPVESSPEWIPKGYNFVEVYTTDGAKVIRVEQLTDAFIAINPGNLYIFKIYYPDRLEVRKVIIRK